MTPFATTTTTTTTTRPKSEIYPGTFFINTNSVGESPSASMTQSAYSKDDNNYATAPATPITPQQQPIIRAARRHDPELVPALQKHIFRDFSPSYYPAGRFGGSATGGCKKDNSMISSMTSTKSFQNRQNNSFMQNRPKKSFSMNRLDQLAQPRRRVEPKGVICNFQFCLSNMDFLYF